MSECEPEKVKKVKGFSVSFVVSNVILLMSCGLVCWTANKVIYQGEELASVKTTQRAAEATLQDLQMRGSRSLESYERMNDARVNGLIDDMREIKVSMRSLNTMPTEQQHIKELLMDLKRSLEEHMKNGTP